MHYKKIVKKRMVLIVFLSLFIFSFLSPFFRLATEGSPIPDDVARLNLSSSADFYAISESDYTTRWILQNASLTAGEDFHDDINTNYWNFINSSSISFTETIGLIEDAGVKSGNPTTNYGSANNFNIYYDGATDHRGFINVGTNYLTANASDDTILKVYQYIAFAVNSDIKVNLSESFDESTITWNTQPTANGFVDETAVSSSIGWKNINLSTDFNTYYMLYAYIAVDWQGYRSTEHTSTNPYVSHCLYKNYYGDGYMYMQTDTTETVALESIDYTTHYNLSSGEFFEVDFQTSSDSQINLILMKDGVVNKTLILSPNGNDNFNRHTVQISVDEFVEFDQLKISSTFEDTDNVKVYDIKTYQYEIVGDYADFYVGSRRTYSVNLTSDTYNLRIFDPYDDGVKVNENITIGTADYFYIYEPIETLDCRLTLFNTGKENHLEFTDYHISINRSLNGEWNTFDLLDNIFTADKETHVYINIYDRFDTLIDSFEKLVASYIDLELEVYSLQIKNLMEQKTTVDINSSYVYPLLSGESIYFTLSKEYYEIGYYDNNNTYQQFTIYLNSNQAYELNRSKMCFLTYTNQRGEYLSFNNYKTYVNESLIYYNVIYKDIGDNVSLEITDLYDISVKNHSFVVQAQDNYVPVILTEYSLKIMNQQEVFNHINITRNPVYYESPFYWSEWIAPSEIIEFTLFAGYYKINLTDNENSAYSFYEYTLNGDDIILISSGNLISSVITNIINVNTTIGNQITNVEINITNQNSAINNTVVNIEINLDNINSTLGNMLVNLGLNITNVANNISSLYVFTNNSFINLDNVINTSFIYLENNIISFNQSISNLIIGVDNQLNLINGTITTAIIGLSNDLELVNVSMSTLLINLDSQLNLINSSISTLIADFGTDLLLINVSINTALFNLNTTIDLIGSNITSNYILLNNSITLTNTNINDSRITIINNLLLVNNTLSTLISDVYSAVYLINNSIYTAVVDLGAYLSLMNNTIDGNLTIILSQNDFLTEMYQMTMFSDMLNWTNIGLNTSLLTSQIDVWTLINNYINQSIEVHLRYQDLIEEITISADDLVEQYLPAEDVEYNLWSVEDEEYLDEWTALPDNKTVSFGFFETEVPIIPPPIIPDTIDYFITLGVMITFVFIIIGSILYFKIRKGANRTTKAATLGKYSAFSFSRDNLKYKIKKIKNKGKTPIIVGVIAILIMICAMMFLIFS